MSFEHHTHFIYGCDRGCEPPEAGSLFPCGVRRFRTLYGLRMHTKRVHGIKRPGSTRHLMWWYKRRAKRVAAKQANIAFVRKT
jgi:hypothetical protein